MKWFNDVMDSYGYLAIAMFGGFVAGLTIAHMILCERFGRAIDCLCDGHQRDIDRLAAAHSRILKSVMENKS